MKAVRGAKKKTTSRNPTPSSSSSDKPVKSKLSKDLLELGKHLVEELGHADRGTTLGRWMAHHLAGLMREAEESKTERERDVARKAAQKLILELWRQRETLPGGTNPMARYERALAIIEVLSSDSIPWQRNSALKLHAATAELHEAVGKLIYGLILSEVKSHIPRGRYEKLAEPFLETAEQRLVHLLGNIRIKIADPGAVDVALASDTTDERLQAALKSLVEKASGSLAKIQNQLAKQETDS